MLLLRQGNTGQMDTGDIRMWSAREVYSVRNRNDTFFPAPLLLTVYLSYSNPRK